MTDNEFETTVKKYIESGRQQALAAGITLSEEDLEKWARSEAEKARNQASHPQSQGFDPDNPSDEWLRQQGYVNGRGQPDKLLWESERKNIAMQHKPRIKGY